MRPSSAMDSSDYSERKRTVSTMETPSNLRRKRLGDCQRSITVPDTPLLQIHRRARGSTSEITSISSIFSNDFVRLGSQKYGKLLSRENTVDSEHSSGKLKLHQSLAKIEFPDFSEESKADNNLSEENQLAQNRAAQKVPLSRRNSPYVVPLLQEKNKANSKLRIVKRRALFNRRKSICNISVSLAITGVLIMMADMEIAGARHTSPSSHWKRWLSTFFKLMVVSTTIGLVSAVVAYQMVEVELYLMESGAEDWRVAMSARRVMLIILEILVCIVCPLPGVDNVHLTYEDPVSRSSPACGRAKDVNSLVPLNVLLSIPMFGRSYLVCRAMVLHSKQFQDTSIWSIASFNHVTVNFKFVTKTLLSDHPLIVLGMFTVTTCCCAAWMFTQCERHSAACGKEICHSYMDSLWLVIVTLLAIGYGDVVPHTYCGRFVAIFAGVAGMGVSAAVISVMTGKIGLTRSEKQVNNFVADSKLANGIRNAAAAILQQTWLIHKHKRNHSVSSKLQVIRHQRKFLHAINRFRYVKLAQKSLRDRQFEFVDVRKTQHEVQETVLEMQAGQLELQMNFKSLASNLAEAHGTMKAELEETVFSINQNQEYLMTDVSMIQRSLGDIQIQLSTLGITHKLDEQVVKH